MSLQITIIFMYRQSVRATWQNLASSAGNSLLGFLWNEYEQKETGRRKKWGGEGGRRKEKRVRSCLPNLNLFDRIDRLWTLSLPQVPKRIILSKMPSLNSKIITPSKKEKIVISNWLTYPLRVHFVMLRATWAKGKQFVQIWQATPLLLEWEGHSSLVPPKQESH